MYLIFLPLACAFPRSVTLASAATSANTATRGVKGGACMAAVVSATTALDARRVAPATLTLPGPCSLRHDSARGLAGHLIRLFNRCSQEELRNEYS